MKAASIALRIADFLKAYPPFEFFEEAELVALARSGRVKFHEVDEIIFTDGQPRDRYIYVVNQGRVRVEKPGKDKAELFDLRGPGDLLGMNGLLSDDPFVNNGVAETDVLLYALPRAEFSRLIESSDEAQRYLAAFFSLRTVHDRGKVPQQGPVTLRRGGLREVNEPHALAAETLQTIDEHSSGLEAARLLQSKRASCLVVVDLAGRPVGKISDADLRDRFIEGRVLRDETAGRLMFSDLAFAKPRDHTGKLLVRMTRTGKRFLVVTEDGTGATRALGLVTERDLFLRYSRFPTLIGEAMAEARSIAELRDLRDRVEGLTLEFLDDRVNMPWLMEMTGVLNRALTGRVLALAQEQMAREGWEAPRVEFSWLMMGSGGRDELLIRSAVYHALMYADPPADEAEEVRRYFRELGRRTAAGVRHCGFLESHQGILASEEDWCLPVSQLYARFSRMIASPTESMVYTFRDAFDFRPVRHRDPLALGLRAHINRELLDHPDFLRHMAKDSLLNQPPRTLFQHYVVDDSGTQTEELEIKHHAILPLVDAARVLALATAEITTTSTYKRFRTAANVLPDLSAEQAGLFREAAEAYVVLAFARAQRGLLSGTDGAVIRPANLDKETRLLLKTAFRTILHLLESIAGRFDLRLRD